MAILQLVNPDDKPMPPMRPLAYDRDSIARAKAFQQAERLRAIREMGIPRDLVALYEVFGDAQMDCWIKLIKTVRAE